MDAALPWAKFAICILAIGLAGPVLTRNGEIIARLTGLSRSWIGLVLLATATSLPELFTGLSAVTIANAPNIAAGDALGSCVFNLMMLVLLDAMSNRESIYSRMDRGHILTAGFGVILIGAIGAFLLLEQHGFGVQFLHVSLSTPIIVAIYFVAMRAAYVYERREPRIEAISNGVGGPALRKAVARYVLAAAVVIVAGSWLPFVGNELADVMGWKATFVGTLFIAGATSMPEVVVTVSALRLGAVDMAIGNLLGSNLFDVLILAIDDLAYTRGSLLAAISPTHAITAQSATIMSGIFVVSVLYRPATRFWGALGWSSIALLAVAVLSSYASFLLGDG